ncbi:nitronate monooxygenase [Robertmurraya korlensis]|uniref:NAD(P)H-dependent flavin oxidoreductase n=1 Tax=Robertmurraya korlensis TaxID=519977 RepID=UPI00204204C3|nr:nitronate monooxygenase [Robertmurraya korlensis]MCM3601692.1 nitronate monooxygenase [Robertmurraya korlensis]
MLENLKIPVIVAPMFLVSSPTLVIQASQGGVVGSIPLLNARSSEILEQWLAEIKEALPDKPWAVNFISHPTNKRFEGDLELIRKYKPSIVITSLGHPGKVIEAVRSYGGLVFSDVATIKHAKKAAEAGVDGLILVCSGAGGHGGTLNPFAFLAAVKEFWNGMIILAGSISDGKDVLAARVLGADFVYMGTRFIATKESVASDTYKEMVVNSTVEDIVYTDAFSGIHANYLIPSLKKEGIDIALLKRRESVDLSHMVDVKAWRDIWSAGQGVTTVRRVQSVVEIIDQLVLEYESAQKEVGHLV